MRSAPGEAMANSATDPLVPDVGTLFEYGVDGLTGGPRRFRVSAWMRVRPRLIDPIEMAESGAFPDECGGHLALTLAEVERDDPQPASAAMEFCVRSQATHVCGKGVAGCVAPIARIKITGMVDWPDSLLQQARETAMRLARSSAREASWLSPMDRADSADGTDEPTRGDTPRLR